VIEAGVLLALHVEGLGFETSQIFTFVFPFSLLCLSYPCLLSSYYFGGGAWGGKIEILRIRHFCLTWILTSSCRGGQGPRVQTTAQNTTKASLIPAT
jgi:hypothetical protein